MATQTSICARVSLPDLVAIPCGGETGLDVSLCPCVLVDDCFVFDAIDPSSPIARDAAQNAPKT